jgi:hypothetical protein
MPIAVTVDTNVLIEWVDKHGTPNACSFIQKMIDWHDAGHIILHAVSRIENDTTKMRSDKKEELKKLLLDHNIVMVPSGFRVGMSPLGSRDVILGPPKGRSPHETALFCQKITEPTCLSPTQAGKPDTLRRKICDYDVLFNHFTDRRDFLVTLDGKDIFQPANRQWFEENCDAMKIVSPEEFVAEFELSFNRS